MKIALLRPIPNSCHSIIGDERGRIGIVSDDSLLDMSLAPVFLVPPGYHEYELTYPVKHFVELKLFVIGRWAIRCGFSHQALDWIVEDSSPIPVERE